MSLIEGQPADTLVFDTTQYFNCAGCTVIAGSGNESAYEQNFRNDDATRILTKIPLDREAMVTRSTAPLPVFLRVTIVDGTFSNLLEIRINIIDLNDNVPIISSNGAPLPNTMSKNFSETMITGPLLTVEAIDYDEGANGTSSFVLLGQSEPPFFNLTVGSYVAGRPSTAKLSNLLPLDRESNESFTVTIVAYEGTDNPQNDTLVVTINIDDSNDNNAIFAPSQYTVSLSEGAPINTTLTTVMAHDIDIGTNAAIEYSIERICGKATESGFCGNLNEADYPFILDRESGELILSQTLDYESTIEYRINIDAFNPNYPSKGSSTALVTVNVEDLNDNPPVIGGLSPTLNLREDSQVSFSIKQIQVTDPDSAPFSKSRVLLLNADTLENSTVFGVQPSVNTYVSLIQLADIDREMKDRYDLIIRAEDLLDPSLYTEIEFSIIITDVNDNSPIFNPPPNPLQVLENTNNNVVVVDLNATDADIDANAEITYAILGGSGNQNLFFIQTQTGLLLVQGALDRESISSLQILVIATDNGVPSRSANITLNITILDENDNPAMINSSVPPQMNVREDEPINSKVLLDVDAVDADIAPNNNITYTLVSDINPLPFHIDSNGRVTVNDTLDRDEEPSTYHIRVVVSDGYNQPDSRNFTFILTDVNDNNPVFDESQYYRSIYENATAGESVIQVVATDKDTPALTMLSYTIVAGNSEGHFTLESSTGILRTSEPLDRESIANYTLEVRVTDGEHNSIQNALVHVTILDINDEIPVFVGAPYTFSINEGNTTMQFVDRVRATSIETGINGVARYYINGEPNIPFIVDSVSGNITATTMLDREQKGEYAFVVRVEDVAPPPHYSTASVVITVNDINDSPPVFNPDSVLLPLSERTPVGSTVYTAKATDADLLPNNVTMYSLSEAHNKFIINADTGSITLQASLDYDLTPNFLLTVIARDSVPPHYTDTLKINITVQPEPDNTCTFPPSFPTIYHIPEDAPISTPMIEFYGVDHNGNIVQNVEYHLANIQSNEADPPFGVSVPSENANATISTTELLNREIQAIYMLNVTIIKTDDPSAGVTQILTIHLIDVNDNSPNFTMPSYTFSAQEDLSQGEQIGERIKARDADFGLNGTVYYYLKEPSTVFNISQHSEPVDSSQSGSLYLIGSLDREVQDSYVLTVVASDKGNPPMTSEVQVIVNVTDVNDNDPTFSPHIVEIEETVLVGTTVIQLQGSDPDEGLNGEVVFSHLPGSTATEKFHLFKSGEIELIELLDFEREEEFIFFITVRDKGTPSRSSNGNLTIRIININDHSPEFLQTEAQLTITIPENYSIVTDIINITARDLDKGTAGVVMYQLADIADTELFFLDPQSGVLRLDTNLDYEKRTQHRVGIVAYDQGMPRNKISNTTVTINVENVNEHYPTFNEILFEVSIAENRPTTDTFIATIRAYDEDMNTITYSISDNENFLYNPITNSLSSTVVFDYEARSLYNFNITASDGKFNRIAGVRVYIDNINDNPPMFGASQYAVQVLENTPVETIILYVQAEDPDNLTNSAVQYSITGGNAGNAFTVHEYTGAISINTVLDFESRQQYSLTVVAGDSGSPPQSGQTTVNIGITNVNEFTPYFLQNVYNFNVTEESPTGANIGKVTALDDDEGTFTDVTYSLQTPSEYFTIDAQTGVMRVVLPIDRETTPNPPSLVVVATDGEKSSTATVNIILQDINDRRPIFPMEYYKFSINSTQSPHSSFGIVSAVDADTEPNSITIYSLSGSPQGLPLAINTNTGALSLTESLPSDHQYSYKVTVMAVDSQKTAFSDQTEVEIFIVGPNNHPPCFPQHQYTVSVVENAVITAPIITVTANDPDTGSYGNLSYSFAETNNVFSINTGNGAISLTGPLDYEVASEYNLTVIAQDGTPRTASALVRVKVNNTNDNAPLMPNSAITLSPVPFTGVSLFQAEATDEDGSSLTFDLNSYTNYFDIDQVSGQVTNKKILSSGNSYELVIVAHDGFHPSTTGTISVTIAEPPSNYFTFLQSSPVQLTIPENSPLMTILNVTTTGSTPSMFSLVKVSPQSDAFSVNPSTGALSTVSNLDYEQHTAYDLVIEARNVTGTSRYSSFLRVQINVTNINEFVPVFTENTIERTVEENIVGQVVIAQVQANDLDSGSFGEIRYTISDNGGRFTIGETSGIIVKPSNIILNREETSRYTLTVTATDLGGRSSVATVVVDVEDENDSPPQFPGNYSIGVFEPGSVGDIVIRIQANDPDTQSSLMYSLGPVSSFLGSKNKGSAPNTFGINPTTGEVTLEIALNREDVDRYIVPASVIDGIHTSTTYITVTVQDINDNSPAFAANTIEVSINELSPVGSFLYQIQATDTDVGSNGIVRYNMSGFQNWFVIDPITGVIRVSQVFTYEQFHTCMQGGPELTGTVEATDGMHTATLTLEVNVREVNNHAPVFVDSPYLIRITETETINTPLMNIQITDSDCATNSAYSTDIPQYYFAPRHLFKWVQISTGNYQLQVKNILQQGIYHFRIEAFNDEPFPRSPELYLAGYAHVTIAVLPQNSHSPEFNSTTYPATVKENVEINTVVVWTSATDDDLGSTGVITYTLEGGNFPFAVNSSTGVVYTTNQLDRETIPSYSFQLVATDHGLPPKNTTATVSIVLSDVNDLPPAFNLSTFRGDVTENAESGTVVLRVTAEDDDLLSGGEVRYSLPLSPPLPFVIDEESGILSTSGMIDFESQSEYQFQVKAQDRGTPPLSSFAQVIISVIGEDEYVPSFSDENPSMYPVNENAMKGDVIGVIRAVDQDDGNDGKVGFLLLNVNRQGLISLKNGSNNTGEIILIYEHPNQARSQRVRRQNSGVSVTATVGIVSPNGSPSMNATFTVMFPPGFIATTQPTQDILIPVVSVVAAVGVLAAAMLLVCFGVMFRMRSKKTAKYNPRTNNLNQSQRTTMSELNNYEMNDAAAIATSVQPTARAQETTASPNDIEEADLPSPMTSSHQLSRNRSTSDLASTVATDALTQDTAISFQYNKAQIEAIYAANASLLHDVSQDSVHSFNSEGGGEADGNVDIDNMMFAKYDLDTEGSNSMTHLDDDYSYDDKDRHSFTDSSGGREEYHFTQSTNLWPSRPASLAARSMAEMSTPGETRSTMYHSNALYEPSQGPVSAYGYSTQGSSVSLLRHHNRYGYSEHDIHGPHHQPYDEYFPDAEINHHAPYPTDMYSHPHSHTQVHQHETGPMEYRPSGARYQFTPDPHPPPLSHYPTPYYTGHSEAATSQHLLRTFEPMPLSSSSTSLSTNASHPLPRHPATYGPMDGYHQN